MISLVSRWSRIMMTAELAAVWFVLFEGIASEELTASSYLATGGAAAITIANMMSMNALFIKRITMTSSTSRVKIISTIVLHLLMLFGVMAVRNLSKESGLSVFNEITKLWGKGIKPKGLRGLLFNRNKKASFSGYVLDTANWKMQSIVLPAIFVEAVIVAVSALAAFVMASFTDTIHSKKEQEMSSSSSSLSTTTTAAAAAASIPAYSNDSGSTSTTETRIRCPSSDLDNVNAYFKANENIAEARETPTSVSDIPNASALTTNAHQSSITSVVKNNVAAACQVDENATEPVEIPSSVLEASDEAPLSSGQTPALGREASSGACYLVYEPDSSGRLVEYYSKESIEGAVGMWVPGDGHTLPAFKFNPSNSRTVVIGNCSAGVIGRKNYASGWCSFLRSAQLMDGCVTVWDPSITKGLAVDVYIYQDEKKCPSQQTVHLETGVPTSVSNALAVACMPKNARFYKGINGIPMNKWLEDGRTNGTSSKFKNASGNKSFRFSPESTSSTSSRRAFGSRAENAATARTNFAPKSTEEPSKAKTLSMERVRHRATTEPSKYSNYSETLKENSDPPAAVSDQASKQLETCNSDAARMIQMMMGQGFSVDQVEDELARQTEGNIPPEIAQELQRVKAIY